VQKGLVQDQCRTRSAQARVNGPGLRRNVAEIWDTLSLSLEHQPILIHRWTLGLGHKGVVMKNSFRIAFAMAAFAAAAFCADNTLGTWKLNPEKSQPPAGQPKITSLIVVREAAGDGAKVTVKGEREDKSKIDVSYTTKYDGK